ncbi:acyltransferase [Bifidobacterium sp. SO4]|uniref:acyltransferase n=1 Tax=Bifidobacterium sp. SO4 TaxID=2809030 RepID=UPI001BDDC880|nr:acyltransferase [Bifidobacterium sp. SO4]MBT1171516.1 acyltransferase [Bifidobacterium sp. SO4]
MMDTVDYSTCPETEELTQSQPLPSAVRPNKPAPLVFVYGLNILSCFAVVLLHTTLPVYGPTPTRLWKEMVGLQALAIFAVPIFFMISGMNLLGYRDRYSTEMFFRKRFWRVGRALLLGSVVCYIVYCTFSSSFYGGDAYAGNLGVIDFAKRFLTNQVNDTYWFFYSIIYLYVLAPVLSLVVKNRRCVEYMLLLTAVIGVLFPLAERFHLAPEYVNTLFGWPLFASVPLLYFLAGYYFHTYWKPVKYQAVIAAAVFILCVAGMTWLGLRSNGYGHRGASFESERETGSGASLEVSAKS